MARSHDHISIVGYRSCITCCTYRQLLQSFQAPAWLVQVRLTSVAVRPGRWTVSTAELISRYVMCGTLLRLWDEQTCKNELTYHQTHHAHTHGIAQPTETGAGWHRPRRSS